MLPANCMRFLFLIFFLISNRCVFAQLVDIDLSFLTEARRQAVSRYEKVYGRQSHLYDGHEYINHDPRIKIHPFYPVDSMQVGYVFYDGVRYQPVPMLYDVVRDELVVRPVEAAYLIRLHSTKVDSFTLKERRFVRLAGDTLSNIKPGFYEVLYNGKVKALARRTKQIKEDVSQGIYQAEYLVKDRYYVLKDGIYHEIRTKQSLINLFADQKKALQKFLRTNNIKFKNQRSAAITGVVREYESLTQ